MRECKNILFTIYNTYDDIIKCFKDDVTYKTELFSYNIFKNKSFDMFLNCHNFDNFYAPQKIPKILFKFYIFIPHKLCVGKKILL